MKKIKSLPKIAVLLSVLFLSACARQPLIVNDLYLTIDNSMPVYPGKSVSYFQGGFSLPEHRISNYKPFCVVATSSTAQSLPLEISPQTVQVSGIYSDYHNFGDYYFAGIKKHRTRLNDWNGPFQLRSTFEIVQPNKQNLTHIRCSRRSSDGYDYHLDVADVNKILGSNGQLNRQP